MITFKNKQKKIQLAKIISKNLLLRNSADELFNYINDFEATRFIIDFKKIKSVTRAFTHQYLLNKKKSKKNIIDVNTSPYVKNMFELIEKTNKT